ncbi:glycosyltransferase [Duganella sp. CY15W]|uniref:glycosyltransferase n=1 Tax=Duganella sp. CY15W TaxID=2692172 RepID=UPI00136A082B|nr:glycosyltransferase [Duganella sp. CY15W]MYM28346.1 glycosyltransferase [Duganella sp. CY15W]
MSDVVPQIRNRVAAVQPIAFATAAGTSLNLVIPSLGLGGAERCVLDVVAALDGRVDGHLFVLEQAGIHYATPVFRSFTVHYVKGRNRAEKLARIGAQVLMSAHPAVVTHMIRSTDLRHLWDMGIATTPVIHNSRQGWHEPPAALHEGKVPRVVAVCRSVADQLRSAGLSRPITVLRHELGPRPGMAFDARARARMRADMQIADDTLLIGMVGQFKAHKAYVRAVRVLAELRLQTPVKLLIAGGWDHAYGAGRLAYAAVIAQARELGVETDLICIGAVENISPWYSAFDVFLNTSTYEGMSIATLEAVRAGCPVVSADVGGQTEAVAAQDVLVHEPADIDAYVDAIRSVMHAGRRVVPAPVRPDLVPRLWSWIAHYGDLRRPAEGGLLQALFVTSNMNAGGAQRSLFNLLSSAGAAARYGLCILDEVLETDFVASLMAARIPCVGLAQVRTLVERTQAILELARRLGVRTIVFWNVDSACKLLLAKTLEHAEVRLVDVSPGPSLFDELQASGELQRRIAFSSDDYLRRLDLLVGKYAGGVPEAASRLCRSTAVIPNGVPARKNGTPDVDLLPPDAVPELAVVTTCRLSPTKCLAFLVDVFAELQAQVPGASLTVVGGVDPRHADYVQSVLGDIAQRGIKGIHFIGPRSDALSFLPAFRVFVMVSEAQGCPNSSLEAMACALPVVANAVGGTADQVVHGTTGYLIEDYSAQAMAGWIAELLQHPDKAQRFGRAGQARAHTHFAMSQMVQRYAEVL